MTPIQLANMIAIVANKGYYYTPHIIKKIKGHVIDKKFRTKHLTTINKKYFQPIINGLFDVYNKGTAHGLNVDGIDICGKTGTAENFVNIKEDKKHGTGKIIFKEANATCFFQGKFADDRITGMGRQRGIDYQYHGPWKDGQMHGAGRSTYFNGSTDGANGKNDEFVGQF